MTRTRITRRTLLTSVGAASLTPALTANATHAAAASGFSVPETALAFAADLRLGPLEQTGALQACRSASVLSGTVAGARLSGIVQSGRIECTPANEGVPGILSALLIVRTSTGELVELRDRAMLDGTAHAALSTRPELQHPAMPVPAQPAMLVGRMDASHIEAGTLRLLAFEIR